MKEWQLKVINKIGILVLLFIGVNIGLTACGADNQVDPKPVTSEPAQNDDIRTYEVTLKDGRTVQCVLAYGLYESSLECDFEGAE